MRRRIERNLISLALCHTHSNNFMRKPLFVSTTDCLLGEMACNDVGELSDDGAQPALPAVNDLNDMEEPMEHIPVFVEIFSGVGRLTSAVQNVGVPGEAFDILDDPSFDMTDEGFLDKIQSYIRSGRLKYIHFGMPCETFSPARWPKLRIGDRYKSPCHALLCHSTLQA